MSDFNEKSHRAVKISIDLAALQHNFQQVKQHATNSQIMPVIKANAYGHGLLQVADALIDADGFGVAQMAEALALREHGIEKPISVFQGFLNAKQLAQCLQFNLRPAIHQQWQLDWLKKNTVSTSIDAWLKINTGMGRLGFQPTDVDAAYQQLENNQSINQIGFMMHFANADEASHVSNLQQLERFKNITDNYENAVTSVSNSAAILADLLPQQNWLRPGIMLYGASPFADKSAAQLHLKPVMSLHAELIAINQLQKGQAVGYGGDWVCPQDMPVGIVNIGYGDGYPRHAVEAPIAVNGQKCKIIGRVSMDSVAVDLRNIECNSGDEVECWGRHISVDEVAASAQTIAYELLCNVGRY